MNFFIDLRYFFPPLVNLFLFLISTYQGDHDRSYYGDQHDAVKILQYPILKLPFLMLAIILLLFFLFTSIVLPLTARPIRLNTGNFSLLLAMAILASIILSPSLFWLAYLLLIVISPWFRIRWSFFERMFNWLCQSLQSVPTIFIVCLTQNEETTGPASTENADEIGRLEIQGNFVQNRHHGLEQLVVVTDG